METQNPSQSSTFHATTIYLHATLLALSVRPKPSTPPRLPLQTPHPPHRPRRAPLQSPFTPCSSRALRLRTQLEPRDGTDGARLAELVDVGGVEGAGAVELEGHGFDVDAEDPGRAGTGAADERGGGDGGDGDVVLALYFVDGL